MKNWTNNQVEILEYKKPDTYSKRYGYIPHDVFLDELKEKIDKRGYKIEEERYLGALNNQVICGNYRISNGDMEMQPAIGFVNSVNGMRTAQVYGMGLVLICRNGMTNSLGRYSRKHLGDKAIHDVRENMNLIVDKLEDEFETLKIQKEALKTKEIDRKVIAQLIGDMYVNEALITETQLSILKKESLESENFKDMTAWSFYNWTTEAFKNNHPMNYDKQHHKFHTYMLNQFEIAGAPSFFKKVL